MNWFSEVKTEIYENILANSVAFKIVSGTIFLTIPSPVGLHLWTPIVCRCILDANKPIEMNRSLESNLKTYFDNHSLYDLR